MKTFKIFLMASAILLLAGINQVSAQKVLHWHLTWTGSIGIDCPDCDVSYVYGTLEQDCIIHVDEDGNWTKLNAKYDKSIFTANTGEVFTVIGAALYVYTPPYLDCFRETLQMFGDRGTRITTVVNIRYQNDKLVVDLVKFHCR